MGWLSSPPHPPRHHRHLHPEPSQNRKKNTIPTAVHETNAAARGSPWDATLRKETPGPIWVGRVKRLWWWVTGLVLLLGVTIAVTRMKPGGNDLGSQRQLPDGSRLVLQAVTVTATNYSFTYEPGGAFTRRMARLLPKGLQALLHLGPQARMIMGGIQTTSLFVVTSRHGGNPNWPSLPAEAEVFDDQGNDFDSQFGMEMQVPGTDLNGWGFSMFPRRRPRLGVRFLAAGPNSGWTNVAEFQVPNPLYGNFPQWTPEPLPLTMHDGSLAITLEEFSTGLRETPPVAPVQSPQSSPRFEPGRTRAKFSFSENGTALKNWKIQTLSVTDATGNEWSPNFGRAFPNPNWITNGTVEFRGRLWPGENAWKLRIEAVSTGGTDSNDVWEVPLALPKAGTVADLTNRWERDGVQVQLAALGSPATELPGEFRGVAAKVAETNGVYALAWKMGTVALGRGVKMTGGWDEKGREVLVVRESDAETTNHVACFRPGEGATVARLRLAITRKHFAEFIARPDIVK